jgi:hypothetical protein
LTLFYVYYIINIKATKIINLIHNFHEFFIMVTKYSSLSMDALTPEK